MASVNKVILLGNLGQDPETRYSSDNSLQITSFSLATSSFRRSPNGEPKEETEWHRVVFFGRQAEIAQRYLRKGSSVYLEGKIRTRSWEKDGQKHYATDIIGETLQLLGTRTDVDQSDFSRAPDSSRPGFQKSANASRDRENDDPFETSPAPSTVKTPTVISQISTSESGDFASQQETGSTVENMKEDDIPF